MRSKILTTLLIITTLTGNLFGQIEPQRVHWKFKAERIGEKEVALQFMATPDPHWHIYGVKDELFPLYFEYSDSTGFEFIESILEIPEVPLKYDSLMMAKRTQFDGKALFIQRIKITDENALQIKGLLDYQTCIEIEDGRCLQESPDFEFKIDLSSMPVVSYEEILQKARSDLEAEDVVNHNSDPETTEIQATEAASADSDDLKEKSLFAIFWIAFAAGLVAIFTPCVLPMVPMTVTFFMKSSENKAKGRRQALMYGISILLIFTILGSVFSIIFGPQFFQWVSTHWIPNVFFFLIFMVFAAAFFGMFEIRAPGWLINKSDSQADKGGFLGPFFMAFTLVLVSFSCTVPIIGLVVVMLSKGDFLQPIVAMFGFGLAFALPFTLFAMFPRWLNTLPKSGGWMNSIKVVLGFIELALGLKFLSVADMTYHWGLLDREIYLAFWIVIFFMMGLYLLGKIKFSHDSDLPFLKVPRLILAILTFTFVVYLIPGLFGAPLKALSGWIPPMATHDFNIPAMAGGNANYGGHSSSESIGVYEKGGAPKYSDVIHSPHGIEGYYEYQQGLDVARKLNRPVFIDFSGHGCVNCRRMEESVWSDSEVLRRLKEDFIVVQLYTDDRTLLPEEEWTPAAISYDGKVKKTMGEKWSELQVRRFGKNSQPQYVLLDSNGDMLLNETHGTTSIKDYIDFLDRGIAKYKELHP